MQLRPSFITHAIGGILILYAFWLYIKKQDIQKVMVILLFSIAVTLHGISHMKGKEVYDSELIW
jgi:cbb3-type cytochrome oxidase subunit 3